MTGVRKGSALLLVLGFMALLVTMAVGFSIRMRTSRHPVSVLSANERGRFLLAAALARAMSEIDAEIGDAMYVDWPGRLRGTEDAAATNGVVPVLTFEALAYLPPALMDEVRRRAAYAQTAHWQRLDYDAGRVAYLAVDVSDLPDANLTPAFTNRSYATGGRLSLRPFFGGESEARQYDSTLLAGRGDEPNLPYVSLLDLNLATGDAAKVLKGESPQGNLAFVVDSCDFTRDSATAKSKPALTDGEAVWRPVLEEKLSETDMAVLDDYLDADSVPSSLEIPCAERIPQIGAVGWRKKDGGQFPVVVTAFPFRRCRGVDGKFLLKVAVSVKSEDGGFSASETLVEEIVPEKDFTPDEPTCPVELALSAKLLPPGKNGNGHSAQARKLVLKFSASVVDDNGEVVDRIPELVFSVVSAVGKISQAEPVGYEVADSRINWKLEHWKPSEKPVMEWRGTECDAGCMVSDAGYLQSLGELALLPREEGMPIEVAELGLVDDRGEGPRVDPYTTSTNVMLTALVDTPCDWRAAATNAAPGNAGTLEKLLEAKREDFEIVAGRLMSVARGAEGKEWREGYDSLDWLAAGKGDDPFDGTSFKERLTVSDRRFLRDYWRGCLEKKQQLFLVFTRVEYGPRGIAVVARDPRPSPDDAPHRMRVLFYHQFDNRL